MPKTLPTDFVELLAAFAAAGVEYLLVGGYAVGFHAEPRATKDMDLWVGGDPMRAASKPNGMASRSR